MRAILLTCSPYECYKLLTGDLSILVRKVKPKCELPIDVYVYVSNKDDSLITSMGLDYDDKGEIKGHHYSYCLASFLPECPADDLTHKIVAKFTLKSAEELFTDEDGWSYYTDTITKDYEVSKLACIEDMSIEEYLNGRIGYVWYIDNLVIFNKPKELGEFGKCELLGCCDYQKCNKCRHHIKLTKASTNYCYIEV